MKRIAVLGSTGSIGSQTLDIVQKHPEDFSVIALAAGKTKLPELARQVELFQPEYVAVPDGETAAAFKEIVDGRSRVTVEFGPEALEAAATHAQVDTVVSGVVGFLGVKPTAAAVKAGKTIALANKETLVAAGCVIMPLAKQHGATIVPVDSEHSAIHQSLSGYTSADIKRILLTGSGGPFRTWTIEQISRVRVEDALKHPNWSMGPKITIDSATLMNKGLEIIEARWLFDVDPSRIKVVIHPQSILHSAVEFIDGSVVGQLGMPDMHLPIHYALYYPKRSLSTCVPALDLATVGTLTFDEPDVKRFPCLRLAQEAAGDGSTLPCVLNAANETAVDAFLKHHLKFHEIPELIQRVMAVHHAVSRPSLEDILEADRWARKTAFDLLGAVAK